MTMKKTSSRGETEMVEVQVSTEAEASSHQPRKRGRKATLARGEKEARKKACDKKRYYNTKDLLQETREMKPQLEILKNKNAELDTQLGKVNSELLPAITQDMKTMKEDFEIMKNDNKKKENLMNELLQRMLREDDWKNKEIPWDEDYLEGEENRLMVLALSERSNGIDDLRRNKFITPGTGSSQAGMSEQHFKQILDELEKLNFKVNALTQDIETLRKNDKCTGISPTQTSLQEDLKQILAEFKELRNRNKELRESNNELVLEKERLRSMVTALAQEM